MVPTGSSFFTVPGRPRFSREGPKPSPIIVWLWGEHDLSTDVALCATLARAIAIDSAGLVLDLSEVEFMAVPTLGVIVRAREFLRQRSRSLTVGCPSAFVRRVIDACGLNDLLGPDAEIAVEKGKALGSWVGVPTPSRPLAVRAWNGHEQVVQREVGGPLMSPAAALTVMKKMK